MRPLTHYRSARNAHVNHYPLPSNSLTMKMLAFRDDSPKVSFG
jgi:hypothetical protein